MDANHEAWNQRHQALRQALSDPTGHNEALRLFLEQHATVHNSAVSESQGWSFSEETLGGLSESGQRTLPANGEHSIAWLIWHMARIEDVTMNALVADRPMVFEEEGWQTRLGVDTRDTGNAMSQAEIAAFSAAVELDELRAYRDAVGRRTRAIAARLQAEQMRQKVMPARLEQIAAQGAVAEVARWLLDYWGGLTVAGLLLMPPTRHNFVHLNEACKLRAKLRQ